MKQWHRPQRRSAHMRWGVIGAVASAIVAAIIVFFLDVPLYPALVTGLSLVLFLFYGFDKRRAISGGGRVPEIVLHGMALAGGFAGGWAGRAAFRHKTRHVSFLIVLSMSTALHAAFIVWMWGQMPG